MSYYNVTEAQQLEHKEEVSNIVRDEVFNGVNPSEEQERLELSRLFSSGELYTNADKQIIYSRIFIGGDHRIDGGKPYFCISSIGEDIKKLTIEQKAHFFDVLMMCGFTIRKGKYGEHPNGLVYEMAKELNKLPTFEENNLKAGEVERQTEAKKRKSSGVNSELQRQLGEEMYKNKLMADILANDGLPPEAKVQLMKVVSLTK